MHTFSGPTFLRKSETWKRRYLFQVYLYRNDGRRRAWLQRPGSQVPVMNKMVTVPIPLEFTVTWKELINSWYMKLGVGGCVGSWRREMWMHIIHFIRTWNSEGKFKNPNSYSNQYLLSATVALRTKKRLPLCYRTWTLTFYKGFS